LAFTPTPSAALRCSPGFSGFARRPGDASALKKIWPRIAKLAELSGNVTPHVLLDSFLALPLNSLQWANNRGAHRPHRALGGRSIARRGRYGSETGWPSFWARPGPRRSGAAARWTVAYSAGG
jgi:hypothetical protein